jgi:hypothetical protein
MRGEPKAMAAFERSSENFALTVGELAQRLFLT